MFFVSWFRRRRCALANIVVNIELRDGHLTDPTRFALGEARRVARALGATVYALVVGAEIGPLADALALPLGQAGADKVLLVADRLAAECPVEPLWRNVLDAIVDRLRPRLFLWPAGSIGLQLGPPLAIRLGANFFPRATFDLDGGGVESDARLVIRRWTDSQDGFLTVGIGAAFAPAVVTLTAGHSPADQGVGPAEVAVLRAGDDGARGIEVLSTTPAPAAAAELASTVVLMPERVPDATDRTLLHGRPDVMIMAESRSFELLQEASPQLVVLLSTTTRGGNAALKDLRLAPGAHVVVLAGGRRGPPRSPLVDHIWKIDRPAALTRLAAALGKAPT
jgi:hypothetical protein